MKEQRKRHKAGIGVKQQKKMRKHSGNISYEFVKKLNKIHPGQTIFTTRKVRSWLASLNSRFDEDLKSHFAYELTCNGCKLIYVGHTCQPITTRVAEHAKLDSPILALILALMRISSPTWLMNSLVMDTNPSM